jgi:hypothetical protein
MESDRKVKNEGNNEFCGVQLCGRKKSKEAEN